MGSCLQLKTKNLINFLENSYRVWESSYHSRSYLGGGGKSKYLLKLGI